MAIRAKVPKHSLQLLLLLLPLTLSSPSSPHSLQKREEVCFQDLGCFAKTVTLNELPMTPEEIDTQYHLYSRQNRAHAIVINATSPQDMWSSLMDDSHFDPSKDTKVIIHGFMNSGTTDWVLEMKDELLKKGDFNIIAVSWEGGSRQFSPRKAAANVFVVAAQVVNFFNFLHSRDSTFDFASLHLIGHSFGAQISGNVGSHLNGVITRITGMDPAEPFFVNMPNTERLDKADAQFVDVIHSDAANFSGVEGYGLYAALGHADFYPNGGIDQPGCSDNFLQGILGLLGNHADDSIACSHGRAHQFFVESINAHSCQFTAYPCSDWEEYKAGNCRTCPSGGCPVMGYDTSASARGSFFLTTTMKQPYCGYEYMVEMDMTDHVLEDSYGRLYIAMEGDHDSEEVEFSRENLHYHQRVQETQLVAVHQSVGNVQGVTVRFHHGSGLEGRRTNTSVVLHRVLVKDTTTGIRTEFCTGDFTLSHDHPHAFVPTTGGC